MGLDLTRMLAKCRRDQWRVADIDFTRPPKPMSRDDEIAVVQYFTDMAGIERLAGALFAEQRRRVDDPTLKAIFSTFIRDEERHARVAEKLAAHYDVHAYQSYRLNPHLVRFRPYFIGAVQQVSAEIANTYITAGEILLDVALLRSLDDFVDDPTCHDAMERINRDESRHIAVDFHMIEHYTSQAYLDALATAPAPTLPQRLRHIFTLVAMILSAGPFLRDVFFAPMDFTDPSGKRMLEAFKRLQLLGRREKVAARPFSRFLRGTQVLFNHALVGPMFGRLIARVIGLDPRVMVELYDDDELQRSRALTMQELAAEVLQLKYVTP